MVRMRPDIRKPPSCPNPTVCAGGSAFLGKTVVLDHLDGGYTIYGHLDTVEVNLNSNIATGRMIGTIGYSGNANRLQRKNLPPHLHFAYVRAFAGVGSGTAAPLAIVRNSGGSDHSC